MAKASKTSLSDDTTKLIDVFEEKNERYKTQWAKFEAKMRKVFEALDRLRTERNNALDDAKRAVREEVKLLSLHKNEKSFSYKSFRAVKPEGYTIDIPKTYQILQAHGLLQKAMEDGILKYEYKAELEQLRSWSAGMDIKNELATCEVPKDLSVTVFAPKPVPEFGAEIKELK